MECPQLELKSGTWDVYVVELSRMPEGRTEAFYLFLHGPGPAGGEMMFRLGVDPRAMSCERLALRCRHPDERRVTDADNVRWRFHPVQRPDLSLGVSEEFDGVPYRVVFSSDTGLHGAADLPMGSALGDLADEDLLELARNHAH